MIDWLTGRDGWVTGLSAGERRRSVSPVDKVWGVGDGGTADGGQWYCFVLSRCYFTMFTKTVIHSIFRHNVCECWPIFKILSSTYSQGSSFLTAHQHIVGYLVYSQGTSLCTILEISISPELCCYITLWHLKIQNNRRANTSARKINLFYTKLCKT